VVAAIRKDASHAPAFSDSIADAVYVSGILPVPDRLQHAGIFQKFYLKFTGGRCIFFCDYHYYGIVFIKRRRIYRQYPSMA
jgi:hypothetical protein